MKETQPQYESRINTLKEDIEKLLEKESMAMLPKLHVTENGIVPVITFISTNPQDLETEKSKIVLP